MQVAAGSWILDAMAVAPIRPIARHRADARPAEKPAPKKWTPPDASGRGLLIDLVV